MAMTRDMPAGDFRRHGNDVISWIADYLDGLRDLPVLPRVEPGALVNRLPGSAPEQGEPMERILEDFRELIVPATTHWNHPRFHAYFSVSASAPGILAETLTAAMNTNGMVWKSSPASTELELVVTGWVREWLGLPEPFFGLIYDTASVSTMHALTAAREFVDPDSRTRGVQGDLTVYTSEHAHSSVEKAAIAIGLGQRNVRKIAVDREFRMLPSELAKTLEADVAAGKRPCCVVPTVGTTSTTSIDPVRPVVGIAARYGAWVHVDAAYGGCAAILPELQHILDGAGSAHSLVVNPHKWMFTPIDLSILFTSRPDVLRQAFSLVPEYLRTAEDDRAINLMDYGVPLGRRFRALKLWFVLRYFGREGVSRLIRDHIRYAQDFAQRIVCDERFEVAAPVPLSLVCFRWRGSDAQNQQLLERINASGVAFLSHTVLDGKFVLRLAYGNLRTTAQDVDAVWSCLQSEAAAL
jgi:aromatic-L-amino-acid/L-tryptophan decarboxylase